MRKGGEARYEPQRKARNAPRIHSGQAPQASSTVMYEQLRALSAQQLRASTAAAPQAAPCFVHDIVFPWLCGLQRGPCAYTKQDTKV